MRIPFLAAVATLSFFPAVAAAAPETAGPRAPNHGIDVIAEADGGGVVSRRAGGPSFGLGFAALWHLSPRWAVGALATRAITVFSSDAMASFDGRYYATEGTSLWGAGAVVRYDYAVLGPFRAWVGGDLGLAFAHDRYLAFFPDRSSHTMSDTRVAPAVGASTGAEIRPIPYLSIGLRGGVNDMALSSAVGFGTTIPGSAARFYGGLDLGVHVPID